jgi:hypothetical protein
MFHRAASHLILETMIVCRGDLEKKPFIGWFQISKGVSMMINAKDFLLLSLE